VPPGLRWAPLLVPRPGGASIPRVGIRPAADGGYDVTFSPPPGVWMVEAKAAQATGIPVQREAVLVLD
ncbi:hypothetical protein, partial [Streptomyces diastatochromogenes]|uniref:hypothetical protein n=1 Tax=Streptomyces diastatochromogenes TaxID=42236 RepID=UPI00369E9785